MFSTPVSYTHLDVYKRQSLVPPPWDELTTKEPSVRATRVRPPGTISTPFEPVKINGLKSTWRGASPFSVKVGQVESANVGCAINLCGSAIRCFRNSSICALVDVCLLYTSRCV